MILRSILKQTYLLSIALMVSFNIVAQDSGAVFEEIIVTAEKRSESLQDISQAVTVLSGEDLDNRQISTFVDISAIAPGVNVAKNEGFKTVITIRGVAMKQTKMQLQRPRFLTTSTEFMWLRHTHYKQIF